MPATCSKCSLLEQDASSKSSNRLFCNYFTDNEKKRFMEGKKNLYKNPFNVLSEAEGNQFPFPPIHKQDEYTEGCWPFCAPCVAIKSSPEFNAEYFAESYTFNKLAQIRMYLQPFQENSIGYRRKLSRDRLNAETSCVFAEFLRVGRDIGDGSKVEDLVRSSNNTISVNCSIIHQLPLETSLTTTTIHPHNDNDPMKKANKMLKPSRRFYGHPTINQSKFPFPPSHLYDKYTGTCWTTCFVCHPNTSIPKFRIGYFHKEALFSKSVEPMQLMRGAYPEKSIHARRMTAAKNYKLDIHVD